MLFTAFDKVTGEIRYTGDASDPYYLSDNETGILMGESHSDGYISDGVRHALPERTSPNHTFNYTTKQWEDPRTLDDLKTLKWTEIKQTRTQAEFGTFTYNGMVFDGDVDAQRRLGSYISVSKSAIAAEQPFQAQFTLADNAEVTLTAQDFVAIEMAKVQQVATAFAHAVTLRAQIDAATTPEEVESVVW